jgi:predicted kinase
MKKTLVFPVGISGSGKSTYIRKNFRPEVVINPDSIRKELTGNIADHSKDPYMWSQVVPQRLNAAMDKYGEAVLDATNVKSSERASILKLFGPDVKKVAIVFYVDPEVTKARIKKDIEMGVDRSPVPDYAVDRQQQRFLNGIQNIESQFDEVITIDQRGGENQLKEQLTEKYDPGDKVWIMDQNTKAPYDSGTVVNFNQKQGEYEVRADHKGNIFLLYEKDLMPYTNEGAALPIVRRNFMKVETVKEMVKEELHKVILEMAAPEDMVPFVSKIPNHTHLINIPNNEEGKKKLEALKFALGDAYRIKLRGRAKGRANIPGATQSNVPIASSEYWGVYLDEK